MCIAFVASFLLFWIFFSFCQMLSKYDRGFPDFLLLPDAQQV
jgi:hypothetical protein